MEQEQALMAQVIDVFARTFDKKAILRGGMVLRILGSPRWTNDLDYLFVPFSSKKDIVADVVACLKQIENVELSYSMNSKCLRVVLSKNDATIQVEAKVAQDATVTPVATKSFSSRFNLPKRIINIVDLPLALANKMAAWNERRLIRDIYDICFYIQMNIKPDEDVLLNRLHNPDYSKLVDKEDYFTGSSLNEFYDFIRNKCSKLTEDDIEKGLSAYLPLDEIRGLNLTFRAALARLT